MSRLKTTYGMSKLKLGWIGDAAASTGFGRVTHSVLSRLTDTFDIEVFGLNFYGKDDELKIKYPYPIYPSCNKVTGAILKAWFIDKHPDLIVNLNDPWIARKFVNWHHELDWTPDSFAYCPVDAPNVKPSF